MALRSPPSGAATSVSGGPVSATTLGANIRTITATTAALSTDTTVLCNATTGAIVLTLPSAAGNTGRIMAIKKIDSSANTVTAQGASSQNIDGANTNVLSAQFAAILIQSDGTQWWII